MEAGKPTSEAEPANNRPQGQAVILIVAETTTELERMAFLLGRERQKFAPNIPEWLNDCRFVSSAKQPSSLVIAKLAGRPELMSTGFMTRSEAARAIRRHPTTVDRLARAGALRKVDGRIVAESVYRYLRGEA